MTIFTMENLYRAYKQCLKYKKNTANALKFEIQREKNLFKLLEDLQSRRYKISRHICFIVTEPSPREIFAANFRDRIVHHLLCNEIQGLFEKDFIENSYANRIGKGTHKALKKLEFYIGRGGINGQRLYFLKMDIKGFFRNINKDILYKITEKKILEYGLLEWWKEEVLWLLKMIIFHDPTSDYAFKGKKNTKYLIKKEKSLFVGEKNKGLPIGNLTSQFFANVYLNELDQYIQKSLGFFRYIRYVIDFLGYFVKPTHILVRNKVVRRFKKKLYEAKQRSDWKNKGVLNISQISMIQSYLGHFSFANSFNLVKKLIQ